MTYIHSHDITPDIVLVKTELYQDKHICLTS